MSDRGITIEEVPPAPQVDTASGLSPYAQDQALPSTGNALWEGARGIGQGLWDFVKTPGEILEGKHDIRDIAPRPNELQTGIALPFAGQLAGMGGWMPAPAGSLRAFSAYQGTGAAPFAKHANEYLMSGEGHMAYAWGHYLGGAEETGKTYQRSVGGKAPAYEGKEEYNDANPMHIASMIMEDTGGKKDIALEVLKKERDDYVVLDTQAHPESAVREAYKNNIEQTNKAIEILESGQRLPVFTKRGGSLINVHVHPEEHELLDWDTPFSKMEPAMQEKLRDLGLAPKEEVFPWGSRQPAKDWTGQDMYHILSDQLARGKGGGYIRDWLGDKKAASIALDDAGIPGIRFLDQFSRHPKKELSYTGDVKDLHGSIKGLDLKHWDDVDALIDTYKRNMESWKMLPMSEAMKKVHQSTRDSIIAANQKTIDWIEKNRDKFVSNTLPQTSNYVMFDPRHFEIRGWNGRPLEFVEGHPYEKMVDTSK